MQINVEISAPIYTFLNKYAKYTSTSRSSTCSFLLSMVEKQYLYNTNVFIQQWSRMKYRPIAPDGNGYNIEHRRRFSITISYQLNDSLRDISNELNVSFTELIARFIKLGINMVFADYNIDLAIQPNDIHKRTITFNTSNVIVHRLNYISNAIGTPRNSLISHAVTEYLINHFDEFDNGELYNDGHRNYTGLW